MCHSSSCRIWASLARGLLVARVRSPCSSLLCEHTGAAHANTSPVRDTSAWVRAVPRGIPPRTNWKQQQLVMQSILQGRSLQLPTFPQRQGRARRKPDHPSWPPSSPAVPGTPWEAEEPFHGHRPAQRQELATLPSDTPRSHRADGRPTPSAVPTVLNKTFCEKMRARSGTSDSKPPPSDCVQIFRECFNT